MQSEIGNKRLMRVLADALQIKDVKQYPGELEVDTVKVVAGLDVGSMAIQEFQLVLLGPPVIDTFDNMLWEIIGDGQVAPLNNPGEFVQRTVDRHFVITSIEIGVDYDAAGLAADVAAGASSNMSHYKSSSMLFAYFNAASIERWYMALAGTEIYKWSFPFWSSRNRDAAQNVINANGPNSIFVPAGQSFAIGIARDPIANWPANTRMIGFASGYSVPVGCALPWM
jgi:hypothetical protein